MNERKMNEQEVIGFTALVGGEDNALTYFGLYDILIPEGMFSPVNMARYGIRTYDNGEQ